MLRRLAAVTAAAALMCAGAAFSATTASAAPPNPKCPNPAGKYPPGQCKFVTSTTSAKAGDPVAVQGTGFSALCFANVTLDGVQLASLPTDATGSFSGTVTIPAGTKQGGHTLSAADSCSAFVLGEHFTVLPAVAAAGSGLPFTGFIFWPLLGGGAGAVVIGAALIVAGRRRRTTAPIAI